MCLEDYVVDFFSVFFSICKPEILRVISGKLLRLFLLLVEGNEVRTEQKRLLLSGGRSKDRCLEALTLFLNSLP